MPRDGVAGAALAARLVGMGGGRLPARHRAGRRELALAVLALGFIASAVYGHPSRALWMVGVTGTYGKSVARPLERGEEIREVVRVGDLVSDELLGGNRKLLYAGIASSDRREHALEEHTFAVEDVDAGVAGQ